jgi:DNA-binding NtrC family response regulator
MTSLKSSSYNGTIVVLDDDDLVRDSLLNALQLLGFQSTGCSGATEFHALIRQINPDVIIVDHMLGGVHSGWEIAAQVRLNRPSQILIMITGYPDADLSTRIEDTPNTLLMAKPFRLSKLESTLADAFALLEPIQ